MKRIGLILLLGALLVAVLVINWRQPAVEQQMPVADTVAPPADSTTTEPSTSPPWFPDPGSDSPVISPLTSTVASDRDTTFGCDLEDVFDESRLVDQYPERLESLSDTLSQANDAELLLAAAYFDGERNMSRYLSNSERALRANPTHPLVLLHIAGICQRGQGGDYCDDPLRRRNTESVLGGNGAYWARVAVHRYELGQNAAALEAIDRAAVAPEFDFFLTDYVQLFERALSASPDIHFNERVIMAIGIVAAMPGSETRLSKICDVQTDLDPAWLPACIAYADRNASDSEAVFNQLIGMGMQSKLYEKAGQTRDRGAVEQRRQDLRELVDTVDADAELVFAADELVLSRFIDIWSANGEVAALEFLHAEVGRLSQDPTYDPCAMMLDRRTD